MLSLVATLASLIASTSDSALAPLDSTPSPTPKTTAVSVANKEAASAFERYGRWQFGVSGGNSTGGGLAVRYWIDEANGFEIHGYAYLSKRAMPDNGNSMFTTTGDDGYDYSSDTGTVATGELNLGVHYLHQVLNVHLFNANGLLKGPCYLRGLTFVGLGGYLSYEDRNLRNSSLKYTYNPNGTTSNYAVTPDSKLNYHSTVKEVLGGAGAGLEIELGRFSAHLLGGLGGYTRIPTTSYEFGPTVDGGVFVRF